MIRKAAEDTDSTLPNSLSETERERQILNAEYELIHAKVMAEMQIDHLEPLTTESEILIAANKIVQRK